MDRHARLRRTRDDKHAIMNNPAHLLPSTRREFLHYGARGIGLLAFSRFAPGFLVESAYAQAPAPEKDRTILVLVQLAGGNPTIVELCREFSALDLMIGMRLHSTLLALRAGVPAIHLAYTLKGHDIYADLGLVDWVVPVEELFEGPQELVALASRILGDPASSLRVQNAVAKIVDANGAALTAALRRVEQS